MEKKEFIVKGKEMHEKRVRLSDDVVIEIVRVFRDIMIEFINQRYCDRNKKK